MTPAALTAHRLTSNIGAEVTGVDLTKPLSDGQIETIRSMLHEHLVLVFREQPVTPEQQIAFAASFGTIKHPPVRTRHDGPAEVNVVDQDAPKGEGADNWHNDNTYTKVPPMGSVLHVLQLPERGGDTMFASMYAAYDALSEPLKQLCAELSATHDVTRSLTKAIERGHSSANLAEVQAAFPAVSHPVVLHHPVTGRPALFVNTNSTVRINELTDAESDTLLRLLVSHAESPLFQVRVRWDTTSVVFLDNLAAQHYAVPDYTTRRVLHRVAIEGQPLSD